MNRGKDKGPRLKYRPTRGLGPYIFSLLIIIIPATIAYYFHLQNQTSYHQKRAFRALDEAGRLLDRNVGAFEKLGQNLRSKVGSRRRDGEDSLISQYTAAIRKVDIFNDIEFKLAEEGSCTKESIAKFRYKRFQGRVTLENLDCFGASKRGFASSISFESLLSSIRRRQEFDVVALADPSGDILYSTETIRSLLLVNMPSGESVASTKHYQSIENFLLLANCLNQNDGDKSKSDDSCRKKKLGHAAFVEVEVGGG